MKISEQSDQRSTHNFDTVLVVIVICAKDLIFAKFCHDASNNIHGLGENVSEKQIPFHALGRARHSARDYKSSMGL